MAPGGRASERSICKLLFYKYDPILLHKTLLFLNCVDLTAFHFITHMNRRDPDYFIFADVALRQRRRRRANKSSSAKVRPQTRYAKSVGVGNNNTPSIFSPRISHLVSRSRREFWCAFGSHRSLFVAAAASEWNLREKRRHPGQLPSIHPSSHSSEVDRY